MKTKTILIKCEVPDEFDPENHYVEVEVRESPSAEVFADPVIGEIITLPTEMDINKRWPISPEYGEAMNSDSKSLRAGANWYKKQLGL